MDGIAKYISESPRDYCVSARTFTNNWSSCNAIRAHYNCRSTPDTPPPPPPDSKKQLQHFVINMKLVTFWEIKAPTDVGPIRATRHPTTLITRIHSYYIHITGPRNDIVSIKYL